MPCPRARGGFIPGIARLGVPPQWLTDGGLGVATQRASIALGRPQEPMLIRSLGTDGIARPPSR